VVEQVLEEGPALLGVVEVRSASLDVLVPEGFLRPEDQDGAAVVLHRLEGTQRNRVIDLRGVEAANVEVPRLATLVLDLPEGRIGEHDVELLPRF